MGIFCGLMRTVVEVTYKADKSMNELGIPFQTALLCSFLFEIYKQLFEIYKKRK